MTVGGGEGEGGGNTRKLLHISGLRSSCDSLSSLGSPVSRAF